MAKDRKVEAARGKHPALSRREVRHALAKHATWVSEPEGRYGERAVLQGAVLGKVDFFGVVLDRADLSGVDLQGADLRHAHLRGASLRGAILRSADLRGATLCEADLTDADLQRCNFTEANLSKSNLLRADLRAASLIQTNLCNAALIEACVAGALFDGTILGNTRVSGCEGLEECIHLGPSVIDFSTLATANGVEVNFLRGAGLPEQTWPRSPLHQLGLKPVGFFG